MRVNRGEATPRSVVEDRLGVLMECRDELNSELEGCKRRLENIQGDITKNEASIKEFAEWLAEHDKTAERDERVVFEARPPNGTVYRVFEDGSAEGFPEGTVLSNRWLSILQYIEGTVIKEQHGGRISDDQAALFLKWKGLNPSDALASRLYQLACLTLDEQAAQASAHSHQG